MSRYPILAATLLLQSCTAVPPQSIPVSESVVNEAETNAQPTEEVRATPVPDEPLRYFSVVGFVPAGRLPLTPGLPELPPPPTDILERLRDGMSWAEVDHPAIEREIEWYLRNQAFIDRVFDRGGKYLHYIVEQLDERDMPLELALLPVVESAFNPFAYSYGRAAGLWQFIPETGRQYGLRQDWWFDARRDVLESTRAALDYLDFLAEEFDGDWLLATAAYNTGEHNVRYAIKRNQRLSRETDFWNLRLARETRAYVPRLLAIVRIVKDPDRYGVKLPSITNAPFFALVETGEQIDLGIAAELAQLPIEDLFDLNAGFNRWATDPDGPHRLLVPIEVQERFELALASLSKDQRMQWTQHRVRRGDTLSGIARRFNTTVPALQELNGLSGTTIRADTNLLVPTPGMRDGSDPGSLNWKVARAMAAVQGTRKLVYVVKPGDTLWKIGRTHDVSVRRLAAWNAMAPEDLLRVGQRLVVWDVPATAQTSAAPESGVRRIDYVVRKGDSLWLISSRFGLSVEQLLEWNEIAVDSILQPGDRLVMYVDMMQQWGG